MLNLIRTLFRKHEDKDPGYVMEMLSTTIAYPDGSKGTAYRSHSASPRIETALASMLAELRSAHPHVAERISLTWGTPDCEEHLESLLFDQRVMDKGHQYAARTGFTPQIMSVLMRLQDEHQRSFCFGGAETSKHAI
jgi:hypothetical protein